MKTVKLSTPFWLGDTVYGVLAFSAGEGNKIKYVVKPMEITMVHCLPHACSYNRICFTATDNETGEEYFNTSEFFAKTKEHAEELKREWAKQLPEWKNDYWKDMFEKHKKDGVLLGGRDFLAEEYKTEHEVEVKDDKTAFIISLDEDGNEIVQDVESECLEDEKQWENINMITAEEAKENVRLHSLDIFHTAIKLSSDREDNYEDLLEEIYWAVRKESHLGHSMISILVKAPASIKEAIDIYKIAEFLEGQGFDAYVAGSIDSNQVEFVVRW